RRGISRVRGSSVPSPPLRGRGSVYFFDRSGTTNAGGGHVGGGARSASSGTGVTPVRTPVGSSTATAGAFAGGRASGTFSPFTSVTGSGAWLRAAAGASGPAGAGRFIAAPAKYAPASPAARPPAT